MKRERERENEIKGRRGREGVREREGKRIHTQSNNTKSIFLES